MIHVNTSVSSPHYIMRFSVLSLRAPRRILCCDKEVPERPKDKSYYLPFVRHGLLSQYVRTALVGLGY